MHADLWLKRASMDEGGGGEYGMFYLLPAPESLEFYNTCTL